MVATHTRTFTSQVFLQLFLEKFETSVGSVVRRPRAGATALVDLDGDIRIRRKEKKVLEKRGKGEC